MTDDAALFAVALANPRDDTPRLVLADWFDDHGEEELGWALRSVPEIIPTLAELVRWDASPARPIWTYQERYPKEAWDVLPAAKLLLRYRDQFPTPPDVPPAFDPGAGPTSDPHATPGPAAFLYRWQEARRRQVAGLRENASRTAAGWGNGVSEFAVLTTDPEVFEYRCCLLQELVVRGHDARTIPGADGYRAAMRDRGHPLSRLPPRLLPIEAGVGVYLPQYNPGGAAPVWHPPDLSPLADPGGHGGPTPVGGSVPQPDDRAWAAVRGWKEESNGDLEARVFTFDRVVMPSELGVGWFRSLGLASLAAEPEPGLYVNGIPVCHAFETLFCAGASGGAYGRGERGAYGRLHAWESLAWLAGMPLAADITAVASMAERCTWFNFGGTDWFADVAWDLGLAALRPDGRSLAVLAATDTD